MLKITKHDLQIWADEQELSDTLFAELDHRLVKILDANNSLSFEYFQAYFLFYPEALIDKLLNQIFR